MTRACRRGFERIVRLLLEHGAKWGHNDLASAGRGGHMNIINILMEAGTNLSKAFPHPIVSAISLERQDMFRQLLKHGVTLEGVIVPEAVNTARSEGLTSMLALLEEHGVDIQKYID